VTDAGARRCACCSRCRAPGAADEPVRRPARRGAARRGPGRAVVQPGAGVLGRYDVFHAHWPEVMVRRERPRRRLAARARLRAAHAAPAGRPAGRRRPHPAQPRAHESANRVERALLSWFDRLHGRVGGAERRDAPPGPGAGERGAPRRLPGLVRGPRGAGRRARPAAVLRPDPAVTSGSTRCWRRSRPAAGDELSLHVVGRPSAALRPGDRGRGGRGPAGAGAAGLRRRRGLARRGRGGGARRPAVRGHAQLGRPAARAVAGAAGPGAVRGR
jgi:hypothetical protein